MLNDFWMTSLQTCWKIEKFQYIWLYMWIKVWNFHCKLFYCNNSAAIFKVSHIFPAQVSDVHYIPLGCMHADTCLRINVLIWLQRITQLAMLYDMQQHAETTSDCIHTCTFPSRCEQTEKDDDILRTVACHVAWFVFSWYILLDPYWFRLT